jgi:hypothetical protein
VKKTEKGKVSFLFLQCELKKKKKNVTTSRMVAIEAAP